MVFTEFFFFFSSRRRHTRLTCDWSSDVCSSDLKHFSRLKPAPLEQAEALEQLRALANGMTIRVGITREPPPRRSEERRVGKECRSRGSPYHEKKKINNQKDRCKHKCEAYWV